VIPFAIWDWLARLKMSLDGLCNIKARSVFAFFECNCGGRTGDAASPRGGDTVCNITSKTEKLILVKFVLRNDQKTQVYEEKLNLIRDPIFRYRFIFGPSTVRQRSVRGPFAVRSRSVNGTSGFFEQFWSHVACYSLRDLGSVRRSSRATLSHFGLISWRWRFVSAAPTHEIRRVTKECCPPTR
jgi:hypothetical protein